jgi:predicted membrane protein
MFGPDSPSGRFTPQAAVALCIIAFGVLKTADNLGWIETGNLLRFWPIGLIAVGLTVFSRAPDRSGRITGGLLVAIGTWMTTGRLAGWQITIFDLWPLVLVALGVTMILRAGGSRGSTTDQRISDLAFWSGVQRRVSSQSFKRADLTAVMGGIEIDFRAAGTGGSEAVIDVFVMMGGVEITVPHDWAVSNQVLAVMGGVEDRTTGTQGSTNRLILRGFVLMGSVEVKT